MAGASVEYRLWGLSLLHQVLIGMVLGVAVGYFFPHLGEDLKVLGTIFINLIKMVVVPLIFLALISGITSMPEGSSFKRVGLRGFSTYLMTAMFAVALGILAGIIFEPGAGLNIDLASLHTDPSTITNADTPPPSVGAILMDLIPTNALRAMTEDHFLQVIVFALFTGGVISMLGDRVANLRVVMHEGASVMFKMVELIVRLAPFAVFGFIAWMVGTLGVEALMTLVRLVIAVVAACMIQYVLFGIFILLLGRISPMPFYRKAITTQLMAFSTSSSKATLTTAMNELQTKMGVSETTSRFMMPLGACINMDGTAIYLGICALFFSQLYGIPLDMSDYLMLLLTCTLGSIGAAGIPSGSIIFMGMVLNSVGLPMEGIALILGVDRVLDMLRTTINITGDMAITLIIDRTEDGLDKKVYFDQPQPLEVEIAKVDAKIGAITDAP